MNFDDVDERDALAGEYVIGLLDASDRAQFESAMADRPELAAAVARWEDVLLPLTRKVEPVDPSPTLWSRIEAALPPSAARAETNARAETSPSKPARSVPARESVPRSSPRRKSLWNSLALWRSLTAAGATAAVLMGSLAVLRPPEVQVYYAVLRSPNEQIGWLVQAKTAGTFRLVPLDSGTAVPAGKALELWTKAEGASGPTSLGLIEPGQPVEFSVDRLPTLGSNQLFEITIEPETGSPIGRPTGPILFLGKTQGI